MKKDPTNIIKNWDELATTPSRHKALSILAAGISRVLTSAIMHFSVIFEKQQRLLTINSQKFDLSHGRIFVIGGGKAAAVMSRTLEEILGPSNIDNGIVTDKYGVVDINTEKISIILEGHPVPD